MVAAAAAAELVLLTACGSTVEASVLRGLLESSGIFSYVQGENHRALLHLASAIELRLLVRRADLADARALLEESRAAGEAALAEEAGAAGDDDDHGDDDALDATAARAAVAADPQVRASCRRVTALAFVPGLGAGHFSVGARDAVVLRARHLPRAVALRHDE